MKLTELEKTDIQKLIMKYPKCKPEAVFNFLSSMAGLTQDEAMMNLTMDSKLYRWSNDTMFAIRDGDFKNIEDQKKNQQ